MCEPSVCLIVCEVDSAEERGKGRAELWSSGLRASSNETMAILLCENHPQCGIHMCTTESELHGFALGFPSMPTNS